MSDIETLKQQAYKATGQTLEMHESITQAIEQEDWHAASDLAISIATNYMQYARIWMGLAVHQREE